MAKKMTKSEVKDQGDLDQTGCETFNKTNIKTKTLHGYTILQLHLCITIQTSRYSDMFETFSSIEDPAPLISGPNRNNSVLVQKEHSKHLQMFSTLHPLLNLKNFASTHHVKRWELRACVLFQHNPQMSLSSFGSVKASGAATPRAPDCSSALGL